MNEKENHQSENDTESFDGGFLVGLPLMVLIITTIFLFRQNAEEAEETQERQKEFQEQTVKAANKYRDEQLPYVNRIRDIALSSTELLVPGTSADPLKEERIRDFVSNQKGKQLQTVALMASSLSGQPLSHPCSIYFLRCGLDSVAKGERPHSGLMKCPLRMTSPVFKGKVASYAPKVAKVLEGAAPIRLESGKTESAKSLYETLSTETRQKVDTWITCWLLLDKEEGFPPVLIEEKEERLLLNEVYRSMNFAGGI